MISEVSLSSQGTGIPQIHQRSLADFGEATPVCVFTVLSTCKSGTRWSGGASTVWAGMLKIDDEMGMKPVF